VKLNIGVSFLPALFTVLVVSAVAPSVINPRFPLLVRQDGQAFRVQFRCCEAVEVTARQLGVRLAGQDRLTAPVADMTLSRLFNR
jgi:hypothetical protein